jgi:hypothetical protein
MPTCKEYGIPSRLWWNKKLLWWQWKKPIKDKFPDGQELLYRWYHPDIELPPDGALNNVTETVLGKIFDPPVDISCNRSTLCKYPTDVLYNFIDGNHRFTYGIIVTSVGNVNEYTFQCEFKGQDGKTQVVSFTLTLKHSPENCMYPHTEIKFHKEGEVFENVIVKPKTLKRAIRSELATLFTVCHYPDSAFIPTE